MVKNSPYSIEASINYKVDELEELKRDVVSGYNRRHELNKKQPLGVNKNYEVYDDIMADYAKENFPDHPKLKQLLEIKTPPVKSENPKKRQNNPHVPQNSKKFRPQLKGDNVDYSDPFRKNKDVASLAQKMPTGGKSRRRRRKTNKKKTRKVKKKTNKKKRKGNKKRKTRARTRRKH